MSEKNMNWLRQISEAPGVSGFEEAVKELLIQKIGQAAKVSYDKIGSVIFEKTGSDAAPKLMIASHMDEVGFMVKTITKEGFLKFTTLGGWWEQVMLSQRVTVQTAKGDLPGVIGSKPPHVLTPEERKKIVQKKDMFIDIGAADDGEAREMGVAPGDPVVPYSQFTPLANPKLLLGKAWDNRIGCAVMADVMLKLKQESHPNTVYGVGTVQEEVGLRGAKTSAGVIDPDIAFIIDTSVAGDTPGITEEQSATKLGKGIGITIYDASMIPHTKLRNLVVSVAKENQIPYQFGFSEGGGTDGGRIHLHSEGVPTLTLSIPTRYLHSHNSIIHQDDYDAAVALLTAVAKKIDYQVYQELLK